MATNSTSGLSNVYFNSAYKASTAVVPPGLIASALSSVLLNLSRGKCHQDIQGRIYQYKDIKSSSSASEMWLAHLLAQVA